jgi:arylsulfatase A-like enzyme
MRPTPLVSAALAALLLVSCKKGEESASSPAATAGKAGEPAAPGAPGKPGEPAAPVAVAPSRGPEHAVFSLVDNRLLGHAQRGGGLVVLGGSAGIAKYLRFGGPKPSWSVGEEVAGTKVATMRAKAAGLTVPLSTAQAGATTLRLRAHSSGAQRLGIRLTSVGGKQEVTTELVDGWNTAEVAVPAGALGAGENEILFFAGKSPVALAWIQLGGAAFGDDPGPIFDAASSSLVLPDGGGAAWYVQVPEQGLVAGDLADAACKVAVAVTPETGAAITGTLVGKGSAIDLAPLAGQIARLELTASGCPSAKLAGAALVVPGAAPEVKKGPPPKHVLLLVMDSLRADHMQAFFPKARAETPFLSSLESKAALFTQFYVQGNETKCSHASLWTSLYPAVHRMIPPNSKIDPKWVTVEEVGKTAGLYTSGASGNGYITPSRGFGEHWAAYRNHIHDGGGLRAEDILGKGFETLAGKETAPWMLYLGWIDTHVSWRAKEPWFSRYAPGAYSGPLKVEASGKLIEAVATGKQKLSDADVERVRALYDSNVSYQDDQIRKMFEKLEQLGILDETMVVMTADHGDELFEVGRVGHGGSSRDSVVWVPGAIYYPPMFPAGRVPEGVELVDLVPTIADALGVKPDPNWQGESLIPLVNGVGRGYPRLSMSSKYENAHAARMGLWKGYWAGGGKPELYDLAKEPGELTNVAGEHPMAVRMIGDALWTLRLHNAEWKKAAWGNPANHRGFAAAMGE